VGARIEVSAEAARIAGLVGGLLSPLEGSSASASASTSSLGAGASASTEAGTETGGGQEISSLKTVDSGAALIIDYGSYGAATDSFRAFKQHAQLSPFAKPGECDLTADVDFALVGEAASPHARPLRLLTQREFLVRLPLAQRVERLLKGKEDGRKAEIVGAVGRLVDDGEGGMGGQYKVLGVVGKGSRDGRGNSREEEEDVYPFVEMPKES
jgi:SAM-dependent MidA family methyltransferase